MIDQYRGKTAVITGGKNGNLGPIMADFLNAYGMTVHCLDLPDYDVRRSDDIRQFCLTECKETPAVLINNAAIDNPPTGKGGFWASMDDIINVNLLGAARCSCIFGRDMINAGGGLIINIGSIMGNVAADWRNYPEGFRKPVAYGMSKAALIQLSRSITMEYGHMGLRSVCLAFGPVDTGKFQEPFRSNILRSIPLGRFVSVESVRAALQFALTCPELAGQQVLCDAGYTCW